MFGKSLARSYQTWMTSNKTFTFLISFLFPYEHRSNSILEQQKPVHCSSGEAPMRCNWRKPMHCSEDQHSQTKNRNPWLIVSQWSRRTTGGNSCLILAPRMFVLFLNTRLGPCESYNYSVFPIWLAVTKTWQSSWVRWVNWYPGKFITLILFPCTLS